MYMARRPTLLVSGVLYHVIARVNQRQKAFPGESHYPSWDRDVATASSLVSRFADRMSESETSRKQVAQVTADCVE
jgi:hypothetical protein